jgi:hypothetical protein
MRHEVGDGYGPRIISVNGEPVKAIRADDLEGWADVVCLDKHGKHIKHGNEIATTRVYGVVEAIFTHGTEHAGN